MMRQASRGARGSFAAAVRSGKTRRWNSTVAAVDAVANQTRGVVEVAWEDGHKSEFLPVWLKDHDPATIHPTSLQRQRDTAELDPETPVPNSVKVEEGGRKLRLEWQGEEPVIFDTNWLRENGYANGQHKGPKPNAIGSRVTWKASDMPKESVMRFSSSDILNDDAVLADCLEAILRSGLVFISDMPKSMDETEAICRRLGPVRETFYGAMWDTAPKQEGEVNDTAYTKDALHTHSDTSYLIDSAGLQLFNCVAQSGSNDSLVEGTGEPEGATKLVDGFKVAEVLREKEPETFEFFCKHALKWHCIEDGVFVKAWAPVFSFLPGTDEIVQFRYNSYDLSPVNYLPPDVLRDYYRHTKVINEYIRSPEYISYMRLNVGEMVVIDNHRVFHGRTAFTGYRNMVGCYIGVDDWQSKLRNLRGGAPLVVD